MTPDLLLSTKIAVPTVQRRTVRRGELMTRLSSALDRRLTLVSAPAGFGKTTLLATWAGEISDARPDLAAAWLSLDEGDSDPTRFQAYLVAALSEAAPALVTNLPALGGGEGHVSPRAFLGQVINAVGAWSGELVLVLDDYHLIASADVHEMTAFLLEHLPHNFHLVIATRADPPLPLSRLRGRGQMAEVRTGDLRFTEAEALTFLEEAMALQLTAEDVQRLTRRTEGWAVGLQMAAVSLQGRKDLSAFVKAFAGSHRYVMDYLLEEVWEQQTGEVQDFLLRTSVLDRMTAPLCDAVCGTVGRAQEMLVSLERSNLFIVPLDERRAWFRYHRLFTDLLQQRLMRTLPEEVSGLHRRASSWYEGHGLIPAAIDHALAAEDYDRAAMLVCIAAEATLARSELTTFAGWIEALPADVLDQHSELAIYIAWADFWQGRAHQQIEADLDRLGTISEPTAGRVAVLRSLFALYRGEVQQAIAFARSAPAKLHEEDTLFRGLSGVLQLVQKLDEGDARGFQEELLAMAHVSAARGNVLAASMALNTLGELMTRQGYLAESEAMYTKSLELACDVRGQRLPIAGQTLIGLATLAWMRGDLDRAEELLEEGLPLAHQAGEMVALDGVLLRARICQEKGDDAAAEALLEASWLLAAQSDATDLDDRMVEIERARYWLHKGDISRARQWVDARNLLPPDFGATDGPDGDPGGERIRKYEVLLAAGVFAAEGRSREALAALDWAEQRFEARRRPLILVDILVLQGWIHARLGSPGCAQEILARALDLAAPRGYARPFLDAEPELRPLLRTLAAQSVHAGFVSRLLAQGTEVLSGPAAARPAAQELVDPLTDRELDVLRLLPTHLSSTEMAERMVVSPNTIRTHIKNIYGKLGAHSRDEAVVRARELRLL